MEAEVESDSSVSAARLSQFCSRVTADERDQVPSSLQAIHESLGISRSVIGAMDYGDFCEHLTRREKLGVQAARVPEILAAAGGVQVSRRGTWYLPQFAPGALGTRNFQGSEIGRSHSEPRKAEADAALVGKSLLRINLADRPGCDQERPVPSASFSSAPTPQEGAGGEGGKTGKNTGVVVTPPPQ